MQDTGEVGWDPISVNYHPPWALRLFMLYIVVVFVIALTKSLRVASHLWVFPNRELGRWKSSAEAQRPSSIGPAAFARNFREIIKANAGGNLLSPLKLGEAEFLYLWRLCLLRAKSIKKLAWLTVGASVWVSLMLGIQMFGYIGAQKVSSLTIWSGSIMENLTALQIGTVAVIALYAQYFVLEGALRRRKTAWDFVLKTAEQSADQPG